MKCLAMVLASLATIGAWAADVEVEQGAKAQTPQTVVTRGVAAKGSDFDVIPQVLGLTGEKLEKYQKALADREAAYKKWEESEEGKAYVAAQKAAGATNNPRARGGRRQGGNAAGNAAQAQPTDAQKKYQELRTKQEGVRRDLRRELNKQFDTDQLRTLAGHNLYEAVTGRLRNAKLDDAQKQQIYALCCALTASLEESAIEKDPYLKPDTKVTDAASTQVARLILRPDQSKPTSAQ